MAHNNVCLCSNWNYLRLVRNHPSSVGARNVVTPETSALGILATITLWLCVAHALVGWVKDGTPKEVRHVRHSDECRLARSDVPDGPDSP